MIVDPSHKYSHEAERANYNIYDDFKSKNPLDSMVYTKVLQSFKG